MNSKQIIKKIAKWLAILSGVLILGLILVVIYGNLFLRGYADREAEGPKVFTELLQLAEESQPFNPDPYVSSLYRPGDVLYKPVLAIQRRRLDIAEKLLIPLANQDNADALFWLAQITYGSPIRAGKAAELYMRSAQLGNPYAALMLDEDNDDCQRFMAGYCNEKWGKLGRKLLKQRADSGDLKAEYYLFKTESHYSEKDHKKLEQLITDNARKNYYYPLYNFINSYLRYTKNISVESKKLVIRLSYLAANNNFPLVMSNVIYTNRRLSTEKYIRKIVNQSIVINSNLAVCMYFNAEVANQSRSDIILGAACAIAWSQLNHQDNYLDIYNYLLEKNYGHNLTEHEMDTSKKISKKLLKNMKPVIYIDEMNPRL